MRRKRMLLNKVDDSQVDVVATAADKVFLAGLQLASDMNPTRAAIQALSVNLTRSREQSRGNRLSIDGTEKRSKYMICLK